MRLCRFEADERAGLLADRAADAHESARLRLGRVRLVGAAQDPPRFLRAGDVVEVEIERLGCLRNPVIAREGKTSEPTELAQVEGRAL